MSEVSVHRLDHEAVMRRLAEYAANELAPRPEVREVTLIGSLARGDWSARSDADVVVVVDDAREGRGALRGPEYAPAGRFPVPVDVLVYTVEEAQGWSPRLRREIEAGVALYRQG